jgi:ferredoxin-thioredoxin reductase catalytic subunit
MNDIKDSDVEKVFKKLNQDAEEGGYFLNPNSDFAKNLVKSLLINEKRYGYWACPCRLATGEKEKDLDIICPCDYRDSDLNEFGCCYCGLYVSKDVKDGKKKVKPIPDRRPVKKESKAVSNTFLNKYPVWRCKVCGYLCARENPPDVCPICKAGKERFEKFS